MVDIQEFTERILFISKKRNITLKTVPKVFIDSMIHSVYYHGSKDGNLEEVLEFLENDSNLIPNKILSRNFKSNLVDLIDPDIEIKLTVANIIKFLASINIKGVGSGELVLALMIEDWKYSTNSDGLCNGNKHEVKKVNGKACIKPIEGGVTSKGLVDTLNKKYWKGCYPGNSRNKSHEKFMRLAEGKKRILTEYFEKLWPGRSVNLLVDELYDQNENFADLDSFNRILGLHQLRWYKEVDGWESILLINTESLDVVNIIKIDENIFDFGVRFTSRMKRVGDSMAVPDGYCVITCK